MMKSPECEVKGPEKVLEAVPETMKLVVLAVPETVKAVEEAKVAVSIEPLKVKSESSVKAPAVVM